MLSANRCFVRIKYTAPSYVSYAQGQEKKLLAGELHYSRPQTNSPIHKAAGSLVTGLQNGKMSMGNRRTERPPDPVLYGGWGGFHKGHE